VAERWIRKIKKDLVANPASTRVQVASRIKTDDVSAGKALQRLSAGANHHVDASNTLHDATTTYTWAR